MKIGMFRSKASSRQAEPEEGGRAKTEAELAMIVGFL